MKYKEFKKELRKDPKYLYYCFLYWLTCTFCGLVGHKYKTIKNEWQDGEISYDNICTRCWQYED